MATRTIEINGITYEIYDLIDLMSKISQELSSHTVNMEAHVTAMEKASIAETATVVEGLENRVEALEDSGGVDSSQILNKKYTLVPFGDSITANGGLKANGTSAHYTIMSGYWAWANIFLNHAFEIVNNAGVGSDTTTGMLSRLKTDVLDFNPNYVIMLAGSNDITQGQSAQVIINNLRTMYDEMLGRGITLIACTILGRDGYDAAKLTVKSQVNTFIKRYCRERFAICVDLNKVSCTTDGLARTPMFEEPAGSGVHPNAYGALVLGREIADTLRKKIFTPDHLVNCNVEHNSILGNPMFTGGSGGLPTGWNSLAGSATFSTEPSVDGSAANWLLITPADDTSSVEIDQATTALGTRFNVGDILHAECEVDCTDITSFKSITLQLLFREGTSIKQTVQEMHRYPTDNTPVEAGFRGVFKTVSRSIPENTTNVRVKFIVQGVGTFKVRRLAAINESL